MRTITLQQLQDAHACAEQVDLFQKTFGDRVEVTEELAEQYAQNFEFNFAARNFLSGIALAEYAKVRSAAGEECAKVRDVTYEEYCKARDVTYEEYAKVWHAAYAAYNKVCAVTFAKLYNAEF